MISISAADLVYLFSDVVDLFLLRSGISAVGDTAVGRYRIPLTPSLTELSPQSGTPQLTLVCAFSDVVDLFRFMNAMLAFQSPMCDCVVPFGKAMLAFQIPKCMIAEGVIWAKAKTCSFFHERCNSSHVTSSNWTQPSFKLMLTF
jgi:hypothetical protein